MKATRHVESANAGKANARPARAEPADAAAPDEATTVTTSEMTPTSAVDMEDASNAGVGLGAGTNPAFSR